MAAGCVKAHSYQSNVVLRNDVEMQTIHCREYSFQMLTYPISICGTSTQALELYFVDSFIIEMHKLCKSNGTGKS